MNTEDRLKEAIEDGEVLKIIYHGGSQPGTSRYIAPIQVGNGKVRARCYSSKDVKVFYLNKLTIMDGDENQKQQIDSWDPELDVLYHYESISDFIDKEIITLAQLGWHITNDEERIYLHSKFKSGSLLNRDDADVWLVYQRYSSGSVAYIDDESGEWVECEIERQKSWDIGCKNQNTGNYRTLDKAAKKFMNLARLLAP
jgi:hypothetical protein